MRTRLFFGKKIKIKVGKKLRAESQIAPSKWSRMKTLDML
jgi:hypothetical protein